MGSVTAFFFGHFDCDLGAIGLGKPRLVFKSDGNQTVADFMRVAEFVEIDQFGRQRFAAGVALALVLVDMQPQSGGFRHQNQTPCLPPLVNLFTAAAGHAHLSIASDHAPLFVVANYRNDYNIAVNTNLGYRAVSDLPSIDWLAVRDLPGILPTQQRRSQETTIALLEAAAVMLRERSLDELSIEDLCKRVGVTIGAFYGRFESKEAFFSALMSLAVQQAITAVRAAVADEENLGSDLEQACRRVVEVAVDVVRRNVGVVRAASQYESVYPERWGIVRATGRAMVDLATPLLLARMGRGRTAAKMRSIGFAFQMMFGTLYNAVLHKPKLVALEEPEMVDRLVLAMFLQLQHEARADRPAR
jgi:AcrR family transcriptional regulator